MALAQYLYPLRDELQSDPLGRGYADMTDQEAADDLLTEYIEKYRRVPMSELHDWASAKRIYKKFVDNGLEDGSLHKELKTLIQGKQEDVNLQSTDVGVSGLISDMVSAGVITQDETQELQSKGTYYISRAKELGYSTISTAWVTRCREEI